MVGIRNLVLIAFIIVLVDYILHIYYRPSKRVNSTLISIICDVKFDAVRTETLKCSSLHHSVKLLIEFVFDVLLNFFRVFSFISDVYFIVIFA